MGCPPVTPKPQTAYAFDEGTRRAEVLEIAASLIATSGLRTSMHQIAGAAGIQTGSLYHHFESKEALLTELLRRYHTDLDHIAERALASLDDPDSRPVFARIADLGIAIARCAVAHRAAIQISLYESPTSNPRTRRMGATPPDGDFGGHVPNPAGSAVERLPQIRCRPAGTV